MGHSDGCVNEQTRDESTTRLKMSWTPRSGCAETHVTGEPVCAGALQVVAAGEGTEGLTEGVFSMTLARVVREMSVTRMRVLRKLGDVM
jgi:predicted RecA/RadA family phage recombinase